MGLFDDLIVEAPLPEGFEEVQNELFQTKDLNSWMNTFVITKDGRLARRVYEVEEIPEEERKNYNFLGIKSTHRQSEKYTDEFTAILDGDQTTLKYGYHGDIIFYTSKGKHGAPDYKWYEFIARFTDGKLQWIRPHSRTSGAKDG